MNRFSDASNKLAPKGGSMRRTVSIAALLLLCACANGASDDDAAGPAGGPPGTVTARFATGGLANVIVVSAVDRLPLRQAVLINPDGERVPAYSIDVDASPPLAVVPNEGFILAAPGAQRHEISVNTMASIALIQLPDPVQYAKTWRDSRIEVTLGDPGSGKHEETLAAPSPPI
jgi:hypothetical protein